MAKAQQSGHSVEKADVPTILAMVARNDRNHDIAAWFGLNQGRIAEVKAGDYGTPPLADQASLPPPGSPGPKARAIFLAVHKAIEALEAGKIDAAKDRLAKAIDDFMKPE